MINKYCAVGWNSSFYSNLQNLTILTHFMSPISWTSGCSLSTGIISWTSGRGLSTEIISWTSGCGLSTEIISWTSGCGLSTEIISWTSGCGLSTGIISWTSGRGLPTEIISWTSGCGLPNWQSSTSHVICSKKFVKKNIKKGSTREISFKQDSKHKFQPNVPIKSAPNKSLTKWIFQENQYQYFLVRDAKQV